jgi:hypothetical protein
MVQSENTEKHKEAVDQLKTNFVSLPIKDQARIMIKNACHSRVTPNRRSGIAAIHDVVCCHSEASWRMFV